MSISKQAIFLIGNDEYGMDILDIQTIEKPTSMEKKQKAPENVKGFINLRGDIIPVYSLRKKFGLEEKQHDLETRLIITKSNNLLIAYEVDGLKGIVDLNETTVHEVPALVYNKDTSYMKSIINVDGNLIILMDNDKILTEDEVNSIQAVLKK